MLCALAVMFKGALGKSYHLFSPFFFFFVVSFQLSKREEKDRKKAGTCGAQAERKLNQCVVL